MASTPSSTASAPKQRNRTTKRTRDGCYTCKKRRIKCDEAKPCCNNCIKTHRVCEGYRPRFEFRDGLNAKFRALTPSVNISSLNTINPSATTKSATTTPTSTNPPTYPTPNSIASPHAQPPVNYYCNVQSQHQSQPIYQYPIQNSQQFQYPPQQPHYQPPPSSALGYQFQPVPYPFNSQSQPESQQQQQQQHHHHHHHHHKSSRPTISLPPIHTLNFHEDLNQYRPTDSSISRSALKKNESSTVNSPIGSDSQAQHSSHRMTLPRIQDCLMEQNKGFNARELPPIHTKYESYHSGTSHSGTSNSNSPSSATSTNSISSLSSTGSSALSRPGTLEPRPSSLSEILNSPPSSNKSGPNFSGSHTGYPPSTPASYCSPSSVQYPPTPYGSHLKSEAGARYSQQMANVSPTSRQRSYHHNMLPVSPGNSGYNGYY